MTSAVSLAGGLSETSFHDWEVFESRLNAAIQEGDVRETQRLRVLYSNSERWFIEDATGAVFVYVAAGDRPPWVWKKIDPFAEPEQMESRDLRITGFRLITPGPITPATAEFLKNVIRDFADEGRIEILNVDHPIPYEIWCRELSTNDVYRLTMNYKDADYRWERIDPVLQTEGSRRPN